MDPWKTLQEEVCELFNQYPGFTATEEEVVEGARSSVQVDVLVRYQFWELDHVIVVECKAWQKRVTQEKVFALKAIVDDLGAQFGIIVSPKGLQAGADKFRVLV